MLKILILFHGHLPDPKGAVPGVSLRAYAHGRGLRAFGHDILYATRLRDLPPGARGPKGEAIAGFGDMASLREHISRESPDRIICVAPDILADLGPTGIPTTLDLYAPRLLEAQFEGPNLAPEAARLLRACAAADGFLVTTPRQEAYVTGYLPLAGVDCRSLQISVVPLSIPDAPRRRPLGKAPYLVTGGVFWPWLRSEETLKHTLATLSDQDLGTLHVFGGGYLLGEGEGPLKDPSEAYRGHENIKEGGFLPYGELLLAYAGAWGALDVMAPSPERRLALSFRQMDYLGSGLPIIIADHAPIAPLIKAAGAGWVVPYGDGDALAQALMECLGDKDEARKRGAAARELGRREFSVEGAATTLLGHLEGLAVVSSRSNPLLRMASFEGLYRDSQRQISQLLGERAALLGDQLKKGEEVRALGAQTQTLIEAVGTLGLALEESLHLKSSALNSLLEKDAAGRSERRALERELEIKIADLEKKELELKRAGRTLRSLKESIQTLKGENRHLEAALGKGETEGQARDLEIRSLQGEVGRLERELSILKLHLSKKSEELDKLSKERDELQESLKRIEGEMALGIREARSLAAKRGRELEHLSLERVSLLDALGVLRSQGERLGATVESQGADLIKKEKEAEALYKELKDARRDIDGLKRELEAAEAALSARLGRRLRSLLGSQDG